MTDLESKVASQTNKKEEERKKWPARFLPYSLSQHLGPSCEVFTACLFILPRGASYSPSPLLMGSGMIVEPVEISTLHDCCIVIVSSIVLDNNTNNHNNLGFLQLGEGE